MSRSLTSKIRNTSRTCAAYSSADHVCSSGRTVTSGRASTGDQASAFARTRAGMSSYRVAAASNPQSGQARSRTHVQFFVSGVIAMAVIVERRSDHAARSRPTGTVTRMHATFLGVSTVLLSDGETSVMTDGFFSRPPLLRSVLRPLRPDGAAVDRALARVGTERLAAVFVAHSHYDHALDSPIVAQRTGAELVGSPSTRRIAEGYGFAPDRFRTIEVRTPL